MTQADELFEQYKLLSDEARYWHRQELIAMRRCNEIDDMHGWAFHEMAAAAHYLNGLAQFALSQSKLARVGVDFPLDAAPDVKGIPS